MTTYFSEVIRGWLGWCPQAKTLPVRHLTIPNNDEADGAPAQRAGLPAPTGWLKRYRDRMLFWAVSNTLAFSLFVPMFFAVDLTRLMMSIGIIAGLGFSVLSGRWFWNRFGRLADGETAKPGPEVKAILAFIIGIFVLSIILLPLELFSVIPSGAAMALPSFTMGFGSFIPWYVLVLILVWEQKTGYILIFDKKTFLVTATRCS